MLQSVTGAILPTHTPNRTILVIQLILHTVGHTLVGALLESFNLNNEMEHFMIILDVRPKTTPANLIVNYFLGMHLTTETLMVQMDTTVI